MKLKLQIVLLVCFSIFSNILTGQNNVLNFDGTDDEVDLGDINELDGVQKFTVETWINMTETKYWGTIFTKEISNFYRIGLYEADNSSGTQNGVLVFVCNGSNNYGSTALNTIWINQWFHLAMVFDGTQSTNATRLKLYINGVLQTLTFSGTIPSSTPNNSAHVMLGEEYTSSATNFLGSMDDLRVWTTARTQTEIQQSMNNELMGSEEGLLMYYTFNQGSAGGNNAGLTTLNDATANNFDGTLANFALTGSTSNWLARDISRPLAGATNITAAATYNTQLNLQWTNGSGSGRAVFMKQDNTGSATPVDLTVYNPNAVFGTGDQIGSTGWYCVYTGTSNAVIVQGLTSSTNYRIMVCEYNGGTGTILYKTDTETNNPRTLATNTTSPPATEPTIQASDLLATQNSTGYNIAWQNGNGSKRAVFILNGTSGTPAPIDNTSYSANSTFGLGSQIGSSGWYCVYNGTENNVTVKFTSHSTYRIMVCEYNGSAGAENYLTTTAANNPINQEIDELILLWTGASGSVWNISGNWEPAAVPSSSDKVTIPDATTDPEIAWDATATCQYLTVNFGGELTIRSASGGTGSLITTGTVSGDVTIERYVSGSSTLSANKYHLVSVPLATSNNSTSSLFLGSYLFNYNPDNNDWTPLGTSTTTVLDETVGYMIYYPGAATTYSFTGQTNTGTFTPTVTYEGNPNNNNLALVPNPYPSNIDWNAGSGWTKTNIGTSIWLFNSSIGNYGVWNGTSGTNNASRYIAVGQAFFVHTTAASPSLVMNNDVRTHTSATFLKNSNTVENQLRITAEGNSLADEMLVGFRSDASNSYDANEDSRKLFGQEEAPQLYSVTGEYQLSINTLGNQNGGIIIPVNFECSVADDYTLLFIQLETFDPKVSMYLKDEITGQNINLRNQSTYQFSHNPANPANRFNLVFGGTIGIAETAAQTAEMWISGQTLYINTPEKAGQPALLEMFDASGKVLASRTVTLDELTTIGLKQQGMIVVRLTYDNNVLTTKGILMK